MLHYMDSVEAGCSITTAVNTQSFTGSVYQDWFFAALGLVSTGTAGSSFSQVQIQAGTSSANRLTLISNSGVTTWGNLNVLLKSTVTTKLTAGFLFQNKNTNSTSGAGTDLAPTPVFKFGAAATSGSVAADVLYLNANGSLTLNGVSTAAGVITFGNQTYLELEYNFTAGTFELFANNVSVLTGTTTLTSASSWNLVTGGTASITLTNFYDDMYVLDDQGTLNNARLGPVRAVALPLLASVDSNFVPKGGAANNLAAVQKANWLTTTYNESTSTDNVGDTFTLNTSAIASGTNICAVQVQAFAKRADSFPRTLGITVGDGTNELSVDRIPSPTAFNGSSAMFETAANGTAWDLTKLNAARVGYKAKP